METKSTEQKVRKLHAGISLDTRITEMIVKMAADEHRTKSNMASILISEAIEARKRKSQRKIATKKAS